uniref:RNA dependent RNA polymerase n=1 Tax=Siphoviridae sp. ctDmQ3 TaxID=2823570 RepID=A0A8S5L828_9CAUD|nr:MAG TPA: RNA dependent RNA polymerase [Siphoviridae sp. ctDmQ3]
MNDKKKFEPRRFRIYKLSTFDTFTDEERKYHKEYKEAKNEKAFLKGKRDNLIASYEGVRRIEKNRLYIYDYDKNGNIIEESEREDIDKQVALAESEMTRLATDFTQKNPLVMEIVYLKTAKQNEILRQIIDRGLDIGEQHYIFFSSTTNQMKRGESILINEEFYNAHEQEITMGLTDDVVNKRGGCNTGKRLAYNGLLMSTSFIPDGYEINIDNCLVVPDFKTIVNEEVECIDHDDDGITGMGVRKDNVEIPQTDGAGMFLPGVLPATAQIRCGHVKGCIFPFDFMKFLRLKSVEGVKPSPIIRDIWGAEHNVIEENIKVLLTGSQVKMWSYYDSWDEFKQVFKRYGKKIAINKFADTKPKGYAKSSYQFIQTLSSEKLSDDKIEALCADTLEYLNILKTDANKIAEILSEPYLSDAIRAYPNLIQDNYVQKKLENKFRSERKDACGNKLILKDSLYSYICPDLYAFCEWLFCGIENPKGIVPRNYVYNGFYNDKGYDKVDCLRSPHLYMEHGIRNLVKGDELELCKEWFCGYDTVVSSHDLLCRVLQFDVDGDEILLTPNKTMIECVPNDKHTLYYKSFDAVKSPVTKENIYKALVASMDNSNIGDISNAMTKNYNNENIDETFNKIMCCYNNLTIDFPKTQHNISLGEYEEKYRQLTNEKPPYFFIYAKGKKRENCKKISNSNCDRICVYIRKKTNNKKYEWKNAEAFNVGVLCNREIKVDTKSQQYLDLVNLMFELKRREQSLTFKIDNEIKQMDKSDAVQAAISRYDVFYDMCDKLILKFFNGDRVLAAENLIDFEYLQRENCDSGKNILWNCYGDVVLKNIKSNVEHPEGIPIRKAHYEKRTNVNIRKIEDNVIADIKKESELPIPTVSLYKEELKWIDTLPYRKNCSNDRKLLFILLVQQKRSKNGAVWVYANKKSVLTCNSLDKMIGDGVCIAKKGIRRLDNMGAISINMHGKDMEIIVDIPEFDSKEIAYEIDKMQRNLMVSFYEYNEERVVAICPCCKNKFIKSRNMKTCQSSVCRKQLELHRKLLN